jgi:hypothetical protein
MFQKRSSIQNIQKFCLSDGWNMLVKALDFLCFKFWPILNIVVYETIMERNILVFDFVFGHLEGILILINKKWSWTEGLYTVASYNMSWGFENHWKTWKVIK